MKRLLIIGLCLCYFTSFSQIKELPFKIGIRGSVGTGWLGIKEANEDGVFVFSDGISRESYSVGAIAEFTLQKGIYLLPEINYVSMACAPTSTAYIKQMPYDYRFYQTITVNQAQVGINLKGKVGIVYLTVGPSYSFITSKGGLIKLENSEDTGRYDTFKKFDYGVNGAIGVEIIKRPSVNLELRYYRGLNKIEEIGYHQTLLQAGINILAF